MTALYLLNWICFCFYQFWHSKNSDFNKIKNQTHLNSMDPKEKIFPDFWVFILSPIPCFETPHESASLTSPRTRQNHSTRVFWDSCRSFVRLSSSNDNFHNSLLLNNINTLMFHFFRINRNCQWNIHVKLVVNAYVLCCYVQHLFKHRLFSWIRLKNR